MPAPGRGVAVLQVGTCTAAGSTSATVTVGGESYTLPFVSAPTVSGACWVLFDGRTGLVLGDVQS